METPVRNIIRQGFFRERRHVDDLAPFRGTIRHGQREKEVEDPRLCFFCLDRHVFDVMEDGTGLYHDLIGFDPCDRRIRIFLIKGIKNELRIKSHSVGSIIEMETFKIAGSIKKKNKVIEEDVYKIYSEFLFIFAAIFETVEGCSVLLVTVTFKRFKRVSWKHWKLFNLL